MTLTEIALKDSKWQSIAYKLTGNKEDAKDIVQDFYLKVYDKLELFNAMTDDVKLSDGYFYRMIMTIFIDNKRQSNKNYTINIDDIHCSNDLVYKDNFQLDDELKKYLDRFDSKLTQDEQYLLLSNYEKSMHEIAKENNTDIATTHRVLTDLRVRCLREDFSKRYKNKRYKRN